MKPSKEFVKLTEITTELQDLFPNQSVNELLPIAIEIRRNNILDTGLKRIENKIDDLRSALG